MATTINKEIALEIIHGLETIGSNQGSEGCFLVSVDDLLLSGLSEEDVSMNTSLKYCDKDTKFIISLAEGGW